MHEILFLWLKKPGKYSARISIKGNINKKKTYSHTVITYYFIFFRSVATYLMRVRLTQEKRK